MQLDHMTCWELCKLIEKETRGLGTGDNCPVPEMALEEQAVLLNLLGTIRLAKTILSQYDSERDYHDGKLVHS